MFELDTAKLGGSSAKDAQVLAMCVIRKRVIAMGATQPNIQALGDTRIIVEIPKLNTFDQKRILNILQSVAFLEFRMVHPKSAELIRQLDSSNQIPPGFILATIEDPGRRDQRCAYYRRNTSTDAPSIVNMEENLRERIATFHAPPGFEMLLQKYIIATQTYYKPHFVKKNAEIKCFNLNNVSCEYDQFNQPYVSLQLDNADKNKFWDLTKRYAAHGSENENPSIPRHVAIVIDGDVISAPHLEGEISNGQVIIRGNLTLAEAQDLSIELKAGPLPTQLKMVP